MLQASSVTTVMRTLSDPTRLALFERIAQGAEVSVSELTAGSGVTQGAVSQHLKSLKAAGLVTERPEGRRVFYRVTPDGLAPLADWMSHYDAFWRNRFDTLRTLLKDLDQ